MQNKGGQVASGMVLVVSTIIILLILLVFFFGSGVIKQIDGEKAGVRVYGSNENGLLNMGNYMDDFTKTGYKIYFDKQFILGGRR